MKTQSFFLSLVMAATTFILAVNCSGSGQKEGATETDSVKPTEAEKHEAEQDITRTEAGKPQFTVDQIFQEQLSQLFSSYVGLKEAFVESDADRVKKEADKTSENLAEVDMKALTGAAHHDWLTYKEGMENSLQQIKASSDIEAQRKAFSSLSDNLYKSIKAYGLGGATAYYEYCPMAFNDEGGYWLSDNEKIRNPYFGDKMLTCGSVKEKLQ
jgi:hypothetical protein